jgi:hypothetical protein
VIWYFDLLLTCQQIQNEVVSLMMSTDAHVYVGYLVMSELQPVDDYAVELDSLAKLLQRTDYIGFEFDRLEFGTIDDGRPFDGMEAGYLHVSRDGGTWSAKWQTEPEAQAYPIDEALEKGWEEELDLHRLEAYYSTCIPPLAAQLFEKHGMTGEALALFVRLVASRSF